MSWQPYALAALAVLVFGLLFYLGRATGWDEKVLIGAGLGGGLGLGLMGLSLFGMLRALKEETKSQALGHVFGGFLLRLVILVVGVLTCVKTGYANPASFGLSFVAAVLLFLGLEVYWVSNSLKKVEKAPAADKPGANQE